MRLPYVDRDSIPHPGWISPLNLCVINERIIGERTPALLTIDETYLQFPTLPTHAPFACRSTHADFYLAVVANLAMCAAEVCDFIPVGSDPLPDSKPHRFQDLRTVCDGWVRFNVPPTHYRSYQGRFYGSGDPTNSAKVLKDNSKVCELQLTEEMRSPKECGAETYLMGFTGSHTPKWWLKTFSTNSASLYMQSVYQFCPH